MNAVLLTLAHSGPCGPRFTTPILGSSSDTHEWLLSVCCVQGPMPELGTVVDKNKGF